MGGAREVTTALSVAPALAACLMLSKSSLLCKCKEGDPKKLRGIILELASGVSFLQVIPAMPGNFGHLKLQSYQREQWPCMLNLLLPHSMPQLACVVSAWRCLRSGEEK